MASRSTRSRSASRGCGAGRPARVGDWKLIEAPEEGRLELYDLAADPRETRNLAAQDPARVEDLSGRIAAWLRAHRRATPSSGPGLSEEDRKKLEALGYVQ